MGEFEPLETVDVLAMADVINHMFAHGKIRRLLPDGSILSGTLRHFCGEDLAVRTAEDVRGEYVRITSETGWEYAVPLVELARQSRIGECALDGGA